MLVIIVLVALAPHSALANLLRDPGFESEPPGWTIDPWKNEPGAFEAGRDTGQSRSGRASLRISHPQPNDTRCFQEIPVKGGRVYRISGWVLTDELQATEGSSRQNIGACLCIKDTWVRSRDLKGSHPWTRVEFWVRTRRDQTSVLVTCRLGYWGNIVKGTAWFDDIRAEEVGNVPESVHVHDLGNPVQNAGFEYHTGGYFDDWGQEGHIVNAQSVQFVFDPGERHRGRLSARIKNIVDNDARWVQQVSVKPGTVYRVSGWIKTDSVTISDPTNTRQIGANLSLYGTWIQSADLKGTNPWTPVEFYVRTGAHATSLPVACRLGFWGSVAKGTAWFDDILVETAEPAAGVEVPVYEVAAPRGELRSWRLTAAVLLGIAVVLGLVAIVLALKFKR